MASCKSFVLIFLLLAAGVSAEEWIMSGSSSLVYSNDSINTNLGTRDFYKYVHSMSGYGYDVYFKTRSSNTIQDPVAVMRGGYLVSQTPLDLKVGSSTRSKTQSDPYVLDSSTWTMTYAGQYGGGINISYQYTSYDLQEKLLLSSLDSIPTCPTGSNMIFKNRIRAYPISNMSEGAGMRLKLNNLLLNESDYSIVDGELELLDENNHTIWRMRRPWVSDANNTMVKVNYSLSVTRFGNMQVDVAVPCDYLNAAVFPVTVDPSWISQTSTHYYDDSGEGHRHKVIDFGNNYTITNLTTLVTGDDDWGSHVSGALCALDVGGICGYCDSDGLACTQCVNGTWVNPPGGNYWVAGSACSECVSAYMELSGTGRYVRIEGIGWDNAGAHCNQYDQTDGWGNTSIYGTDAQLPVVTVNAPADATTNVSLLAPAIFEFNVTSVDVLNQNLTLVVYNGSSSIYVSNFTAVGGTNNDTLVSLGLVAGSYKWGAKVCDAGNNCVWTANRTLTISYANAVACTGNAQCSSSQCVDKVCCGSASCTLCMSCNVTGQEGTCYNDAAGADPDNACFNTTTTVYGCGTGTCNGSGACGYVTNVENSCPACYTCAGASTEACVAVADNTVDSLGSNLCYQCRNCDGAGSCVNQGLGEDFGDYCGVVQCDDGASPSYYYGFVADTQCSYALDVSNSTCKGTGSCQIASDYCPTQSNSSVAYTCANTSVRYGCTVTTRGGCIPYITAAVANQSITYLPPVSDALTNLSVSFQNGTSVPDDVFFTYNGTFGGTTAAVANGSASLIWNATGIAPGNYSVVMSVNDSLGIVSNSTVFWVYIRNNTVPSATLYIMGGAGDSSNKTCNVTYYDFDGHAEAYREYNWSVNGTWIVLNDENITTDKFKIGDNITCAVIIGDAYNNASWEESPNLMIGDTTPPVTWNYTITPQVIYTNEFSVLCHNANDSSGVSSVIELLSPTPALVNYSTTEVGSTNMYCYNLVAPAVGTWNWTRLVATDAGGNSSYATPGNLLYVLQTTTTLPTVVSGGGGGGIATSNFEVRPRSITTEGERPTPAKIVGSFNQTYTILNKVPSDQDLSLIFVNTTVTVEGRQIDATGFFKTSPAKTIHITGAAATPFAIYCDIPNAYRYEPYGLFTSTLVVGGSTTEQIKVTCESSEHAGGAASLTTFLAQEIVPGVSVGAFLSVLVIFAVVFSFMVKKKR